MVTRRQTVRLRNAAAGFVSVIVLVSVWAVLQVPTRPAQFYFETQDGIYLAGETVGTSTDIEIILLHSAYGSSTDWDAFRAALAAPNRQITTVDLRGHGNSLGKRDWQQMPTDIVLWLTTRENADCTILIGASFGANVASQVAQQVTVDGLVLLSSGLDYFTVTHTAYPPEIPVIELYAVADDYAAFSMERRVMPESVTVVNEGIVGHGTAIVQQAAARALMQEVMLAEIGCLQPRMQTE